MENDLLQMSLLTGLVPEEEKSSKNAKTEKSSDANTAADAQASDAADATGVGVKTAKKKSARKPTSTADNEAKATEVLQEPEGGPAGEVDLSELDQFLCFALYSANHAMNKVYKPLLAEVGLTYPQFLALTVLWQKDKVPVGDLTEKLQLETSTITPLLKRLEAMGLVNRKRSQKDERQVRISLTKKGRDLQAKTAHFPSSVLSATGLSEKAAGDLRKKVTALRETMRKSAEDSKA